MSGNEDLRRSGSGAALLIIDMINPLDFPGADGLREPFERMVDVLLSLRDQADATGTPVVYVNDNHGRWRSERSDIVEACLDEGCRVREAVRRITPRPQDYFVVKPQVSGFYATTLPVLLPRLGATRLVLTGVAADICVLFTAADAHMREYDLWAPADAVAAEQPRRAAWALEIMKESLGAETRPTRELDLEAWLGAEPGVRSRLQPATRPS